MAVFSGNGSQGSPSFTFSSDTDTGFYRYGDGDIGITLNGLLRARFEGSALNISNAAIKVTPQTDQNLYIADAVSNAGIFVGRWAGGSDGCVNDFFANRGASVGTYTAPTSGDELCRFRFFTHDTTAFREVAGIFARVGTYIGTNDVGGQLIFSTRPTGVGSINRAVFRATQDAYLRMEGSSGGIQFNGDSAAANALDDYEEGTFTPVIEGGTTAGTGTYTSQLGRYTKIGRTVSIIIRLAWTAHTGTGNFTITGLPFAAQPSASYVYGLSAYASRFDVGTTATAPMIYVAGGSSRIESRGFRNNADEADTLINSDAAGSALIVNGTYQV